MMVLVIISAHPSIESLMKFRIFIVDDFRLFHIGFWKSHWNDGFTACVQTKHLDYKYLTYWGSNVV